MSVHKFIRNPLWATLVGALVAAMVVSFSCLCKAEKPHRRQPMSRLPTLP